LILEARQLAASYGESQILFGIDFELERGETACILGRNGVGKTTTMKVVMGLLKPLRGSVVFDGIEIGGKQPYEISRLGMAYVPQGRQVFPDLTTKENLLIAARKGGSS
jgi:branched-chain amino acid transport system ATP-binding protein